MPFKVWAIGEEVLAADFNTYVQTQTVAQFVNVTQRDAQWAGPPIGAMCVTTDTLTLWVFNGSAWVARDAARVLSENVQTVAIGAAIGATETVIYTFPPITIVAGRRYYSRLCSRLSPSAPLLATYQIRLNNVAGQAFGTYDFLISSATPTYMDVGGPMVALPVGAVTLCVTAKSNTGTVQFNGFPNVPAMMQITERL